MTTGSEDTGLIDVVFASDYRYAPHLATAVVSLLETNRKLVRRIFVITDSAESEPFITLKNSVQDHYRLPLEYLSLRNVDLEGLYVSGHVSRAAYSRFLIGDLLPETSDFVLYLDCDLIVVGSLSPLIPFIEAKSKHAFTYVWAVARDNPQHLKRFGHSRHDYFNSGVLLVNLVKWRESGVADELFRVARQLYGRIHLWDQDVLNLVLENHWDLLPETLNETSLYERKPDARVVHFVGATKPWMWGSRHPYRKDYDYYRSLTPFWPYRRSGLSAFLRKRLIPKPLQKPSRLTRRLIRRLRRAVGKILGR